MSGPLRFLTVAILAAGLVTLGVGCGGDNKKADGEKKADGDAKDAKGAAASGGMATPEATFEAAKAAEEKGDWHAFVACVTPEGQEEGAMGMVLMAGFSSSADVKAALEKHGLTEEWGKKVGEDESIKDPEAAMKKMLEPVKDHAAFLADVLTALAKEKDSGFKGPDFRNSTLKDVKIDGDTATATREFEEKGTKETQAITFKKVDGNWRMEMPKPGGGPAAGGLSPDDFPGDPPGDSPKGNLGDTPTEDPGDAK
ncbi:MAG: hypothetical protein WD875_06565 [Pirellulales bacterium]